MQDGKMRSFAFIVEKSRVYIIASRVCEHSNLVRFEKRAAKALQHGHIYGDIRLLHDNNIYIYIYTYLWSIFF